MKRIYFDNAATTPLNQEVLAAMTPFFREEFGNASSLHEAGQTARKAVEDARQKVASFLSCSPREIIFTSGATESDNLAIKGVVEAVGRCQICQTCTEKQKIPHLIVSSIEHHAVLDSAKHLEKLGYEVTYLGVDKDGLVDPKEIVSELRENTILVSIMYANNEVGTIEPIEEVAKVIKEENIKRQGSGKRIYFHTDAVQAIQYLDCNVDQLGVDLMSLSAHKFYGPKGVGALYIRRGTPIIRQQDGGGQEFGQRAGTENVAGIAGMGCAIERIQNAEYRIKNEKMRALKDGLIDGVLKNIPDVILTGHPQKRLPHIASFCVKNVEGEAMVLALDEKGICVSSGSACTAGNLEPSHVLIAMGIPIEITHGSIRISLGKENTEKEVDYFLEVFPEIVRKLREMSPFK